MPYSAEFSIAYGGFTVGGSTARRITDYTVEEHGYDTAAIEFEFITNASTAAAFITEINACRDAFRDPRNDITITNGAQTRTYNHSTNTALDTNPTIVKDGDPADAGFSRHFRVRIEFGLPADNVGTAFRRHSTVSVAYSASRQRTVTVTATYTANSTDGTTGAFAQYRNNITAYLATVTAGIDAAATWETVGEPQVERNETDKVVEATIVAEELLHNQAVGTLNDADLVGAVLDIAVEDIAPGDSTTGGITISGESGGAFQGVPQGGFFSRVGTTVTSGSTGGGAGNTTTLERPQKITVTYEVSVDASRTLDMKGKWKSTIRPHLKNEAKLCAATGPILVRETPLYELSPNRFRAEMEFVAYKAQTFEQRIRYEESMQTGWVLKPTTERDQYAYYEYPGPAVRIARAVVTYRMTTRESDPKRIVAPLVGSPSAAVTNLLPNDRWRLVSRRPGAVNLLQGRDEQTYIAEVDIETTAQYRNRKRPSIANAGKITGSTVTL